MAAQRYTILNSAQPTTAAPVKQPTGSAIRTMMQLRPATGYYPRIVEWGCSFDASAAATPGQIELFETSVAATMSTAYAAGDIMPHTQAGYTPANTAGSSGVPFNLSTTTSGFATAAVTEGTVAGYRLAQAHMLPPTGPLVYSWPLGREFEIEAQKYLRVRVTFAVTVNMYIYIVIEI
jgi:hypothetical protein